MTQEEAQREAAKRERHKSRHMTNKNWQAVHDSVKGWHVALVDCPFHAERVAREKAKDCLRSGNFEAFKEAAADALMARVHATIAAHERFSCPDCGGAGWVIGTGSDTACCGGSEWECGGRGCTGPVEEQVQVQEPCERCLGTGDVRARDSDVSPAEDAKRLSPEGVAARAEGIAP